MNTTDILKELGYARAIIVPHDNDNECDTLLINGWGVEWLNCLLNGAQTVYTFDSPGCLASFVWLPGTLEDYDDHTVEQIEADLENIDEVSATRDNKLVHLIMHNDVAKRACLDIGWHEFVKPVPAPKPGNLETGEPFQVDEAIELEDMKDLNFRFYKLLDNQGDLVALVQVDEGDEEQYQILQVLAEAPKARKLGMAMAETLERKYEEST